MFDDAQLFVLRELEQAPRTFEDLCGGLFHRRAIEVALTAFYLVGSITSSPARAEAAHRKAQASVWPLSMSQQPEGPRALPHGRSRDPSERAIARGRAPA